MAGRILDILSTWNDSAVTASVRAYRMEQSLSLKFDNYTYRVDLMQFAAHSTLSPEFGLVGYFRFSAFVGFSPNAFRCAENPFATGRPNALLGRTPPLSALAILAAGNA